MFFFKVIRSCGLVISLGFVFLKDLCGCSVENEEGRVWRLSCWIVILMLDYCWRGL